MTGQRSTTIRTAVAFILAIGAALIVGGALARGREAVPSPTAAAPISAHVAAVGASEPTLITPTPSQHTTAQATTPGAAQTIPAANEPILATPPQSPAPTTAPATPTRTKWIVAGRWVGSDITITEPFTVHGPWRLCWTLPAVGVGDAFQIMIGDATQTNWEIKTGPTGASAGSFDLDDGGSFRLMFHNDTPYVVLAIEPPPGVPANDLATPPCGK